MRHSLVLESENVRLEPLSESNLDAVRASGNHSAIWDYTFQTNPFQTAETTGVWFRAAVEAPGVQAFAIRDTRSGQVAGSTRFFEIDGANRKLEIGWTFHAPHFWRTHVNTESKYLLLRHAFEAMDYVRVQFKAEAINRRSHAAILRLGATHEGTLRSFRIRPDGELRDVGIYSIVADEWPMVKERLLAFAMAGIIS
ncbi:MAG TPA: GNAT family protein [Candidatus Baltobacteraceae bacterium]|jgi:RimJ/RimL family protein N-acetyltransferase|nr:GNAT family protein [Candidatus Baltobacteraceae bacterium]